MSIEFVEPDESVAAPPEPAGDPAVVAGHRPSAWPGRLLAAGAGVAAALAGVSALVTLYVVERTAFVVDFDGTTTQDARIPYDAFGHADTVPLRTGVFPAGDFPQGADAYGSRLSVSLSDGVSYGWWWLGLAAALLVVAVWGFARPRSARPAAAVAAVGGLLLGSVGAAWLSIRTVAADSVPQIRLQAHPAPGLWLLVAAGGVALLAGLLAGTRPPLRRLLPRRRPT